MMIQTSPFLGFDIIGDVHGCASALENLLQKMGYHQTPQGYQFKDTLNARQVIFVGDLVDRGSEIRRTLSIVKAMCDNGSAQVVMGNHEFNAIAYHTPHNDDFLRPRNERSNKQIEKTLEAFKHDEEEWQFYLAWFRTLPLFIEFESFRVVHACWDNHLISEYWQNFQTNLLLPEFMVVPFEQQALLLKAVDRLTKGLSLSIPEGQLIKGRDGFYRKSFRVDFWSESINVYDDIVFQPDPIPDEHRIKNVSDIDRDKLVYYAPHEKPLFVGHYWLSGVPALVKSNIACLDYSAVNQGKLVAYRYNVNDLGLSNHNFVYVDCSLG
jgi:hypothetical protein